MNFKAWWEQNKSEYFYSEEDLAEDAYIAGYTEALSAAAEYAESKGGCGLLPFELRRMAEGEK